MPGGGPTRASISKLRLPHSSRLSTSGYHGLRRLSAAILMMRSGARALAQAGGPFKPSFGLSGAGLGNAGGRAHACFYFRTEAAPLVAPFDEWVPRTPPPWRCDLMMRAGAARRH